jgi:hypothetical protein
MSLVHIRTQYAVGQGFFHTGELREGPSVLLRYVVDCGAMWPYTAERNACIDRYRKTLSESDRIDVLFITHAHADHINGVARLLNGVQVDTIVLPLLNVVDRLLAYAQADVAGSTASEDDFFNLFVLDPVEAVSRLKPRRILIVRPASGEGGGAPYSGGPNDENPGPRGIELGDDDESYRLKIIGTGLVSRLPGLSREPHGVRTIVVPDTMALTGGRSSSFWLLAPYVDPTVHSKRAGFLALLATAKKMSVPDLEIWLQDPANIKLLTTVEVKHLKSAYKVVGPDLNITSLCVYSGLPPGATPAGTTFNGSVGKWEIAQHDTQKIAWLGTGDAALKDPTRLGAFLSHYKKLRDEVVTLVLPHHGSDESFSPQLLTEIFPDFCVVAADEMFDWPHPGRYVSQQVASKGLFLSVVTSDARSEIWERIQLL